MKSTALHGKYLKLDNGVKSAPTVDPFRQTGQHQPPPNQPAKNVLPSWTTFAFVVLCSSIAYLFRENFFGRPETFQGGVLVIGVIISSAVAMLALAVALKAIWARNEVVDDRDMARRQIARWQEEWGKQRREKDFWYHEAHNWRDEAVALRRGDQERGISDNGTETAGVE